MIVRSLIAAALFAGALLASPAAQAAQVCAWMTEKLDGEEMHDFQLYLQADQELEIYYKIGGEGLIGDGSRMHSPGSGTFVLHKGVAEKPWGFGATLSPPGQVDFVVGVHKKPVDIFSETLPPLLASFDFKRKVPEGEKKAPATFATKQCKTVAG